jgi:hypothetical protein
MVPTGIANAGTKQLNSWIQKEAELRIPFGQSRPKSDELAAKRPCLAILPDLPGDSA